MIVYLGSYGYMPDCDYHVIPRRGAAPTWESPGTTIRLAVQAGESHQEIATPACGLARNDICYSVLLL